MTPELKQMYIEAKTLSQEITLKLETLRAQLPNMSVREVVDGVYALRETRDYLDKIKKDVEKMRSWFAKVGVLHCEARDLTEVRTKYCTGKPVEDVQFIFPQKREKDPKGFDAVMKDLGIPEEIYKNEVVRIHWPEFQNYCNKLLAEAKNPPGEISPSDSMGKYDFKIVKRRGVNIDSSTPQAKPSQEGNYTKGSIPNPESLF
jgi:hypothetical protein